MKYFTKANPYFCKTFLIIMLTYWNEPKVGRKLFLVSLLFVADINSYSILINILVEKLSNNLASSPFAELAKELVYGLVEAPYLLKIY